MQPPLLKTLGESKLRDKVAALVNFTNENNKIKEDIRKQRQEDMKLLANRFSKQKQITDNQTETLSQALLRDQDSQSSNQSQMKTADMIITSSDSCKRTNVPPPPPPPPPAVVNVNNKRRSRKYFSFSLNSIFKFINQLPLHNF